MMSLLKIIDNPTDDIALVTVLRSMIGGFTDNELIEIRLENKNSNFYNAMCYYKSNECAREELKNKVIAFLNQIEEFRKAQEYMPLDEFIWKIYLDTGYYSYVSLMPNGILRASNLKMLFEKAKQYESTNFKGLYNFISFIDKLKSSSKDMSGAKLIGENEDVVRIMSIHKSKGLEFPVVFLSNTQKKFNMQDINNDEILLHQDLGLGPKYINYEEGESYTTLAREAIKVQEKLELISEEMRVFYVALTRAKEKLIITGIDKDYKTNINKKEELLDAYKDKTNIISPYIMQNHISYLDWLELVNIKRKKDLEDVLEVKILKKKDLMKDVLSKDETKKVDIEEKLKSIEYKNIDMLKEKLDWEYKYSKSNNIIAKSSVTRIKNMKLDLEEEESEAEDNIEQEINYKEPEFLYEKAKLTGARKGTLVHMILSKLDEKVQYNIDKVRELVDILQEKGIINETEKESIDIDKIYNFTKTNIWQEMKKAKEVQRERPFYMNIKASEIYGEDVDENILVQGVIDLYYINEKRKYCFS